MDPMDSNETISIRESPTGWAEIPAELLDQICEYIPKRGDVLPMRIVNKHWSSVINSVSEHRILQQWTVWLPFINLSHTFQFPAVDISPRMIYAWDKVEADYYSILVQDKDVNPFPNNSLHIQCTPRLLFSLQSKIEEKLHEFLTWHGSNLVTLKLVLKEISPDRFYKILEQVPNLRAFTIAVKGKARDLHERVKITDISRPETLPTSPCPQLEYLQILQGSSEKCQLVQWLLKLFAPQLKSLEIDSNEIPPFDQEYYPTSGSFGKLKWLKIRYPPNLHFLRSGFGFKWSLQNFSIQVLGPVVPIEGFLEFINNFSGSLSNLYLYIEKFEYVNKPEEYLVKKESCFPKLVKLTVNNIGFNPVYQLVNTNFSPRFRNLRTLQLLDFQWEHNREYEVKSEKLKNEAMKFCKDLGLWKYFPKLENIKVYPIQLAIPCKGKFYDLYRTT